MLCDGAANELVEPKDEQPTQLPSAEDGPFKFEADRFTRKQWCAIHSRKVDACSTCNDHQQEGFSSTISGVGGSYVSHRGNSGNKNSYYQFKLSVISSSVKQLLCRYEIYLLIDEIIKDFITVAEIDTNCFTEEQFSVIVGPMEQKYGDAS